MPERALEQVIDRPADAVFAFVATDHFRNHPRWDPTIEAVRGPDGPVEPGARAVLVRRAGRRRIEERCEVTRYEPPRLQTIASRSGPLRITVTTTVTPLHPQRSVLSFRLELGAAGPLALALPLIRRRLHRNLRRGLERIAALMAEAPGPAVS